MLVAEYDTSGTMLRRYVPGARVDEMLVWYEGANLSAPHWLHTDQQGSVIAATDDGATATPYAYSVMGEPKGGWSSSAPAFRYTGQVAVPSAQIYYYKARMYDPALGRFLQTDPVRYAAGMNLYTYVGNDPINGSDPYGTDCPNGVSECVTVSASQPPFSWESHDLQNFLGQVDDIAPSLPKIYSSDTNASPDTSGTNGGSPDWSKIGVCLKQSALQQFGFPQDLLSGSAALSGALATPIPKSWLPFGPSLGSRTTNALSALGEKYPISLSDVTFGAVDAVTIGGRTSGNLLRVLGRANPYVFAGLTALDLAMIGYETYQCSQQSGAASGH